MNNQQSPREEMDMLHRVNLNLTQDLMLYREQNLSLRNQINKLARELEEKTLLLQYAKNSLEETAELTRNEAIYFLRESYHQNYIN